MKKPKQGTSVTLRKLKPFSSKQQKNLLVYSLKRKVFLIENPVCQFAGCSSQSEDLHHKFGRGKYLNDVSTFSALCREHHTWVHENPVEAEKIGLWVPISKRK